MKKIIYVVLIVCFLVGCTPAPSTYQYPNRNVDIMSVELLLNETELGSGIDEYNMRLVRSLESDEISAFMNAIYELPTKTVGTPPPWGYGRYLAKVTYTNGDIEIFGILNIEFIPSGHSPTGIGDYYFPDDGFENLYMEYADFLSSS